MIWSWGFYFGCNNCNVKQDFILWGQLSQYNIFWQRSWHFLEIWTATVMSSSISQVFLLLLFFIWSQTVQNEPAECSWIALAVLWQHTSKWRVIGAISRRTKILTGMHCFKSDADRSAQCHMKANTPHTRANAGDRNWKLMHISLHSKFQVWWTLPCEFDTREDV